MNTNIHNRLKVLLEETSDAYYSCGHLNADFATFASMSMRDFRYALHDPSLSEYDFRRLLRRALAELKLQPIEETCWSSFLAQYITSNANQNSEYAAF